MLPRKNPLTVVGTITRCWLFTYQTPLEAVRPLLPRPLEPVTHGGYAFWNIVFSRLHAMRPKGFPSPIGVSYWHVAYRIYVYYPARGGEPIEGLYFVRSDCDNPLMTLGGNLMTDFNFHSAPIRVTRDGPDALDLWVASGDANVYARLQPTAAPELPAYSAFASLDEAARALKYKPFGISVDRHGVANVVRITRREDAWRSRLVRVETARWAFFDDKPVRPEICYQVEPIIYQWNRGERVLGG